MNWVIIIVDTLCIKTNTQTHKGEKMTDKSMNPFEIRFELLNMAKDYLETSYQMQYSLAQQNMVVLQDQGKLTIDTWKKLLPERYTMEDIIAKAQELYGFVGSKDGKSKKDTVN